MMGNMDMRGLAKRAQEMQKRLGDVEKELAERVVEGTAGGGMVTVRVTGSGEIVDLKIDPSVIDPGDREMLQDLVAAAVNEGMKKSKKLRETEIQKVTGMAMPGMF